jgi:hypothetical protein
MVLRRISKTSRSGRGGGSPGEGEASVAIALRHAKSRFKGCLFLRLFGTLSIVCITERNSSRYAWSTVARARHRAWSRVGNDDARSALPSW